MIRSELIHKLAEAYPHLSAKEVEAILQTVLDEIVDAMANGNRVELRGFGTFSVRHRAARMARNPKTGERVPVGSKFVPAFKTGKELHGRLNPDATA